MKGVTDVASELSPEISPVIALESDRPEWEFLKNAKVMGGAYAQGAVAAQNCVVRLRNPAGTGVIAIVRPFWICSDTANFTFAIGRNTDQGVLATVHPIVARDTRTPILAASSLSLSTANNIVGAGGSSYLAGSILAQTMFPDPDPFMLTPGNQIQMTTIDTNLGIRGAVYWLERRLDALELE